MGLAKKMLMGGEKGLGPYGSVDFDGTQNVITYEDAALDTSNPFTLEVWVKLDATGTSFFLGVGSYDPQPLIGMASSVDIAYFNGDSFFNTYGGSFSTGVWYHFALVHEGAGVYVWYIDGVESARDNNGGSDNAVAAEMKIYIGSDDDDYDSGTDYVPNGKVYGARISFSAKYTSNFTPDPEYGVEGDTDFLMASRDGNIVDDAGNYTIATFKGGVSASPETPA